MTDKTPNSKTNSTSVTSHKASSLSGEILVAGDKSISHRSLMLSSQVLGTTHIEGLLEGEDVLATAKALQSLGVDIIRHAKGKWSVQGVGIGGLCEPNEVLDMGNAGTGARLMMGLLASYPFTTTFTGDSSLCSRPMGRVITPLSEMGVGFMSRNNGRMPLSMQGSTELMPIEYCLPVASAQVKSAVLLAGLGIAGKTTVLEPEQTRDHTERMLNFFGIEVESNKDNNGINHITIQGNQAVSFATRNIKVPADPSSAAFPIVASLLIKGSKITLPNVGMNEHRIGLFTTLKEMGADISYSNEHSEAGEEVAYITVSYSKLRGVNIPAERAPSMIDEYPILAVAASFANGKTVMNGLDELRVKESDRLSAIINGLESCGVKTELNGDNLTIFGLGKTEQKVKGGANIKTNLDHRIGMSFLVMGMVSETPITIDDKSAIATSFPNFVELMNDLGADIRKTGNIAINKAHVSATPSTLESHPTKAPPRIIAIDGPAASGKGTLARRLAAYYGYSYLDTGSLYRAVGLRLQYAGKSVDDEQAAFDEAQKISDNDLVNPRLRQEDIGRDASVISAYPKVRKALLEYQQNFAKRNEGAVLDGRDIGTVVCPNACIKLFITAGVEARAGRRHRELQGQGIEVVFDSVLQDLKDRDERDLKRDTAPLVSADDAYVLDTTNLRAQEVFDTIIHHIEVDAVDKVS